MLSTRTACIIKLFHFLLADVVSGEYGSVSLVAACSNMFAPQTSERFLVLTFARGKSPTCMSVFGRRILPVVLAFVKQSKASHKSASLKIPPRRWAAVRVDARGQLQANTSQ